MTNIQEIRTFINSPAFNVLADDTKQEILLKEKQMILSEISSLAKEYLSPIVKLHGEPIHIKMSLGVDGNVVTKYVEPEDDNNSMLSESVDTHYSEEAILYHPLDWSPFEYGFTIDKKYHEKIFEVVGGMIPKGTSIPVIVEFEGEEFKASIGNANVKGRSENTIRLLYSGKHSIGNKLKELFPDTYSYLKTKKSELGGRAQIKLPEDLQATITLYSKNSNGNYKMECK